MAGILFNYEPNLRHVQSGLLQSANDGAARNTHVFIMRASHFHVFCAQMRTEHSHGGVFLHKERTNAQCKWLQAHNKEHIGKPTVCQRYFPRYKLFAFVPNYCEKLLKVIIK